MSHNSSLPISQEAFRLQKTTLIKATMNKGRNRNSRMCPRFLDRNLGSENNLHDALDRSRRRSPFETWRTFALEAASHGFLCSNRRVTDDSPTTRAIASPGWCDTHGQVWYCCHRYNLMPSIQPVFYGNKDFRKTILSSSSIGMG